MKTTEIVNFGEERYEFTWVEGGDIPSENISQASGYIFNDKSEMLIVKSKNWTIPGGHPEMGETPIEILKREVMEEASVTIENISYLGHVKVTNLETNGAKYQLRFVAYIKEINEFEGKLETSERLFVNPNNLSEYILWAKGEVFTAELDSALSKISKQ